MNSEKQSTNLQMTLREVNRVGEGQKNVPKLRFKGYEDAWEQRKLGEVSQIVGGGTPSTGIPEYWDGDIDWYSPVEIGEEIFVSCSQRKITQLGLEKSSAKILPVGTVLFTSRAGIGNTAILEKEGCTNQGFQSIVPKDNELDSYFIFSCSHLLKKYGETKGAGSTFVEISGKQMSLMPLNIPEIKEQKSVGNFFRKLDSIITLHQRKYDALKSMKKTMLSKMFPKNGEDVPEIRFKGFTDAWEQRKLGEITEKFEYGLNAAATDFDGVNQYLRITDIDDESREFNKTSLTSPETNLDFADNYILKQGDLLFARTGASVGKTYQYKESDGRVYYAGFLIRARLLSGFNVGFVFQNTLTKRYENFISITSQRSGQPGINAQEYASFKLLLPKFEEQEQISNFFTKLDNLITLHQRKLDELKNMKKTLLQQMFV